MNETKCDKISRKHTILKVIGITALTFLILVSIADAAQLADVPNSGSNNVSDLNKTIENDIKTQDKAIEINPQNSTAWTIKGIDFGLSGKSNEAIKAFDKAIEINPQYSDAWKNKGIALDYLNKSDEAIKAFDKVIDIKPRDSKAWYYK